MTTDPQDVAKLLHSAGLAVQALTQASQSTHPDTDTAFSTVEKQKQNFKQAASQYFSLLSAVDVRLRRQIYALEEAEIISAEAPQKEQTSSLSVPTAFAALGNGPAAASAKQLAPTKALGVGGGLGSLDVGWLNSRNDDVGKAMEAELWAEAEQFIDGLETGKASSVESERFLPTQWSQSSDYL